MKFSLITSIIACFFCHICFGIPTRNHQQLIASDSLKLNNLTNKNAFTYKNSSFQGSGWDSLMQEVKMAHFIMLGEEHGEAEIPVFTTKLALEFKPKALVVEIDPYTALQLKKVSANPDGYIAYFKNNPYAFAFYSWKTELELVRQMQLNQIDIWGLNEINFLSLGRFFKMLATETKSKVNKNTALALATKYNEHDKPLFADVNRYNEFSAYKLKTSTIDSLSVLFKNESDLCKKMLSDLKASIPVFTNVYKQRVNIMKGELINYLSPYIQKDVSQMPKLLFKFGANHLTRTNDLTKYFEVGNFADNLAEAADKTSLHILIFGKKGTINEMVPVDNNIAIKPYDVKDTHLLSIFKPLTDQVKEHEWALFDLRPIRKALKNGTFHTDNAKLKGFILGFDLLVVPGTISGSEFIY